MLLEKNTLDENNIITLKLSSGEEIIGKFIKEDDTSYLMEKPLMLAMSQKGVGMAPILMTVNPESRIKIQKHAVMILANSDEEIAKQYIYQTTGIQPVSII